MSSSLTYSRSSQKKWISLKFQQPATTNGGGGTTTTPSNHNCGYHGEGWSEDPMTGITNSILYLLNTLVFIEKNMI